LACCDRFGYGYPDPTRLLDHIEALASAAQKFGELGGQIGKRFEDWIMEGYGLEVALFDSSQTGKQYFLDGNEFWDLPHVKVDDHKHGLARAGRIHFVMDNIQHRLVMTYLGAHR
jgi:hypothetical protein